MYSRIILWSVLSILVIMYHLLPSYYRQLFITRISSLSKLRNTKLFKFKANYLYSNGVLQVKSKFYATVISEREIVIISLAAREEECFCRNFPLRNYIHSFFYRQLYFEGSEGRRCLNSSSLPVTEVANCNFIIRYLLELDFIFD